MAVVELFATATTRPAGIFRHVWSKRVIAPPHGNFVGWVARAMLETFAECSGQLAQFPDDD